MRVDALRIFKELLQAAGWLEEYASIAPELRVEEMLDDSEVRVPGKALLLGWKEEVHVDCMKKLLALDAELRPPNLETEMQNVRMQSAMAEQGRAIMLVLRRSGGDVSCTRIAVQHE